MGFLEEKLGGDFWIDHQRYKQAELQFIKLLSMDERSP